MLCVYFTMSSLQNLGKRQLMYDAKYFYHKLSWP